MVLTPILISLLSPTVMGHPCNFDESGVSFSSSLDFVYFDVPGKTFDKIAENLTNGPKPFSGRTGKEWAWHESEWRAKYPASGSIKKVCAHSASTIYLPRLIESHFEECYAPMADYIRKHEMEHYHITIRDVESFARGLIGSPAELFEIKAKDFDRQLQKAGDRFDRDEANNINQMIAKTKADCTKR